MSTAGSRRGRLAAVVIGLWLGGLGLLARKELFRPHMDKLHEAGMSVTPGATYYAVLQQGQQIGFASSTIDTTDGGISVRDYLVADLPIAGELHRATARTEVELTRALRVSSFKMQVDAGLAPIDATGSVQGDSVLVVAVRTSAAQVDTHRVSLDGPILLPTLVPLAVALGERPKKGARLTLPVFDPIALAPRDVHVTIDAESVFVIPDSSVFDARTSRWTGARPDTVRAWRLATDTLKSTSGFRGWVDAQGRLVHATQLLGMTLERRPYEVAFENWKSEAGKRNGAVTADRDIYETTAIAASKTLRKNLDTLRIRLTGADLTGFDIKGYRQRLRGDTLTISREGPRALAAAYRLPGGARGTMMGLFLDAEPLLEVHHPRIAVLAARLRGRDTNPRVVAERINRWVYDSVRKSITIGVPSALATLDARRGDCNEHTQLAVALSRAAGIPARVAAGLAYVDGKFYYHAWPEVWLERWVAIDPTFGQFPADAAHLRLTVGGLGRQADLLRLMGPLKIDVLSSS
ncbi:MAG TPA: transglutaminase-like domain-containing protein [Gemmatimonadaceae bacterium]|nr:transglutaminase-like domain-containing protein [Gemmatimonadaceae bacterium]